MSNTAPKLVIIGGGPAGYTAAIYASRAGLSPILYQGPEPGGQLMTTTDVENYPGYPQGIQGPQMMEDFRAQAVRFGTDIRTGIVTAVDFDGVPFRMTIDHEQDQTAQAVIIATGSTAKWLGLPSEKRLMGRGVSACATCDGFFFRDQPVAVVGGGDTAAEEASYLANLCSEVHMIIRRDVMRASKIMQERVLNHPKIKIWWSCQTQEILGDREVEAVCVVNSETKKSCEIPIKGFFVAIGHQPNTAIFKPYLDLNAQGYIETAPKSTKTSKKGVFAAGDVQDYRYRQAVTAAGTGCMAALDAEHYLNILHD